MALTGPIVIRARRQDDLRACADLVREVHARDRYPRFAPADIARFLQPPDPLGCWVAEDSAAEGSAAEGSGEIVGHVALVPRGLPATLEIAASALGRPADELAVVARLFVSPRARGRGAGRLLLDAATSEARSRGLHPVLDVDTELSAAIALYESAGWTRAGQLTVRWTDDGSAERVLTEYVYLGPEPGRLSRFSRPKPEIARYRRR
jgi:GNAT superfamily N-acetyltransferase